MRTSNDNPHNQNESKPFLLTQTQHKATMEKALDRSFDLEKNKSDSKIKDKTGSDGLQTTSCISSDKNHDIYEFMTKFDQTDLEISQEFHHCEYADSELKKINSWGLNVSDIPNLTQAQSSEFFKSDLNVFNKTDSITMSGFDNDLESPSKKNKLRNSLLQDCDGLVISPRKFNKKPDNLTSKNGKPSPVTCSLNKSGKLNLNQAMDSVQLTQDLLNNPDSILQQNDRILTDSILMPKIDESTLKSQLVKNSFENEPVRATSPEFKIIGENPIQSKSPERKDVKNLSKSKKNKSQGPSNNLPLETQNEKVESSQPKNEKSPVVASKNPKQSRKLQANFPTFNENSAQDNVKLEMEVENINPVYADSIDFGELKTSFENDLKDSEDLLKNPMFIDSDIINSDVKLEETENALEESDIIDRVTFECDNEELPNYTVPNKAAPKDVLENFNKNILESQNVNTLNPILSNIPEADESLENSVIPGYKDTSDYLMKTNELSGIDAKLFDSKVGVDAKPVDSQIFVDAKPVDSKKRGKSKPVDSQKKGKANPVEYVKKVDVKPVEYVIKVDTKPVDSPKKVKENAVEYVKKVDAKPVESPKKVKANAVEYVKKVDAKPVDSPKKVKANAVEYVKKVDAKPVDSPKKVKANAVEYVKKVDAKPVDSPKKVKANAVDSPKKVKANAVEYVKKVDAKPVEYVKKVDTKPVEYEKKVDAKPVDSPKKVKANPVDNKDIVDTKLGTSMDLKVGDSTISVEAKPFDSQIITESKDISAKTEEKAKEAQCNAAKPKKTKNRNKKTKQPNLVVPEKISKEEMENKPAEEVANKPTEEVANKPTEKVANKPTEEAPKKIKELQEETVIYQEPIKTDKSKRSVSQRKGNKVITEAKSKSRKRNVTPKNEVVTPKNEKLDKKEEISSEEICLRYTVSEEIKKALGAFPDSKPHYIAMTIIALLIGIFFIIE